MPEKTIAQKLQLKPGRRVLLVNAPAGYPSTLGAPSEEVLFVQTGSQDVDIIQLFIANRQELIEWLGKLRSNLAPGGMLWVTYHKGTSGINTDVNRDSINAYAQTLGLQGVAMISIDEDWSALRLKVI